MLDTEPHAYESESEEELQDAWTPTIMQQSNSSQSSPTTDIKENIYDFMDDHPLSLEAIPEEENEGLATVNDQAELLQWHYYLCHLSFRKIRLLSLVGILPRHLTKIRPPKCTGCLYGNMTRKPWRTKTK
eukprot:10895754-Ditylum_brightwellii.AAC.1